MKPGARGNTGAWRSSPDKSSFTPYDHRQSQERRSGVSTATGSPPSISRLTRRNVSVTPHLGLAQPTPLQLPANNPQTNVTNHPTPPRSQIRQIPYIPARTQCEFARAQPVSFSVNGVPGISVAQAIAEDVTGLDGRDDGISSFENSKVLFRTQFEGHDLCTTKINTRRHVAGWEPITRCKLAKEIGRKVQLYIEGHGLQGDFPLERVYFTRLVHVSKGSWQADLWREDPVTPDLGE